MPDITTTNLAMTPAWQDHLSPGAFVSFRFHCGGLSPEIGRRASASSSTPRNWSASASR